MKNLNISQRFVMAVVAVLVLVGMHVSGYEFDAEEMTLAIGGLLAIFISIASRPPDNNPGDIMALLKDPRFIPALVALGAAALPDIPEELWAGFFGTVVALAISMFGRGPTEAKPPASE